MKVVLVASVVYCGVIFCKKSKPVQEKLLSGIMFMKTTQKLFYLQTLPDISLSLSPESHRAMKRMYSALETKFDPTKNDKSPLMRKIISAKEESDFNYLNNLTVMTVAEYTENNRLEREVTLFNAGMNGVMGMKYTDQGCIFNEENNQLLHRPPISRLKSWDPKKSDSSFTIFTYNVRFVNIFVVGCPHFWNYINVGEVMNICTEKKGIFNDINSSLKKLSCERFMASNYSNFPVAKNCSKINVDQLDELMSFNVINVTETVNIAS